MARRSRKFRPSMHMLEDRATPALFGVPWSDPTHLTVSFVPDGTQALNKSSSLFGSLDSQIPNSEWQTILLHAIQTWSEAANVNIGFVQDTGLAFGTAGVPQGDARFGDIRIGALPMSDVLAAAIPPDPVLVDTLAGDIFLNTHSGFDPLTLYGVALHEVGHALGLQNSDDPLSVMHSPFEHRTTLSDSDIAAIRSLYSPRTGDKHEGRRGNGSFEDATRIRYGSWFDGSAPLVVFGDLTTRTDVDTYLVPIKEDFSGPLKIRLQTEGISLLAPKLSIFDSDGELVGTASGSGAKGDTIELTVPFVNEGDRFYLRVEPVAGSSFQVGRYGLAVSFLDELTIDEQALESVLRGPYTDLSTRELVELMLDPPGSTFDEGRRSNDTFRSAKELESVPGTPENSRYRVLGSNSDGQDVDYYEFEAPSTENGQPLVLTATVRAIGPDGAVQRIELFDSRQNRVASTILANGNGTFTVQAINVTPDKDYFVRVGDGGEGDYRLDLSFGQNATPLSTFANGAVDGTESLSTTLYIAESMVFGFALASTGPVAGVPVLFSIYDSLGNEVFSMTGSTGDTLSAVTGFLEPGEYRARIKAIGSQARVGFRLIGTQVTDPIGPQISDSSAPPLYVDPWDPEYYLYPTGAVSLDPYLWVYWSIE